MIANRIGRTAKLVIAGGILAVGASVLGAAGAHADGGVIDLGGATSQEQVSSTGGDEGSSTERRRGVVRIIGKNPRPLHSSSS